VSTYCGNSYNPSCGGYGAKVNVYATGGCSTYAVIAGCCGDANAKATTAVSGGGGSGGGGGGIR
jgi:hypothetical protein